MMKANVPVGVKIIYWPSFMLLVGVGFYSVRTIYEDQGKLVS